MKNKTALIYIGVLAFGILFGWILFGKSSQTDTPHNHPTVTDDNKMWTCSMHPQIMQPEPGDCPICGMDLIPASTSSDGLLADQFKLTKNAMALANIQTSIVGKGAVENNTFELSGKIVENEEANTVQISYFSGRIEKLNVSFTGENIHKGQLLATIYSPELYAAQQELLTAASMKASQPALYKAVRNKLKLWKLSDEQINLIEKSRKVTENVPIYATVSGTVTEKLVAQGDYIKQGQTLLKIANLNTVWAEFDVYENQIDLFKKGQEVAIITKAYPNTVFKGKVAFIEPIVNTKTRTVNLRVVLDNKSDVFKPGMFVSAQIEAVQLKNKDAITIPSSAVLWTGKRSVVYVKTHSEEAIFEMREITIGDKMGDQYEVLEGLQTGDTIVSNGTFTVDAAAQLQGKKSMMNKPLARVGDEHLDMNHNHLEKPEKQSSKNKRIQIPSEFQQQLKKVVDSYIFLKNALVKDEANTVTSEAKKLLTKLSQVDMKLLSNQEAHNKWMPLYKEIQTSANFISKTTALTKQRSHFKNLSFHIIHAVELFGVNEKVYLQFCPMANQNKGAYWLSKEETVFNPYYGDSMLTCGEVKQVIE